MYKDYESLLIETTNPFINLSHTLEFKDIVITRETVNLIKSLLNSPIADTYDINERYYTYSNKNIIQKNVFDNLYSLKSDLGFEEYKNFFTFLLDKGLKIEEKIVYAVPSDKPVSNNLLFYKEMIENDSLISYLKQNSNYKLKKRHSIYGNISEREEKLIYFFEKLSQIHPYEEHLKYIEKYQSYHGAVNYNKINLIKLLNEQKIPVNIKNKDLTTPLMFAKNKQIILLLDSFGADWLAVNIFNEDAFSSFAKIHEKETREEMIAYGKSKLDSLSKNENLIDKEYIEERIKINLLNLVSGDKTKAELDKYIKANKPKNIDKIVDDDNNNLFMICLKNNHWARARLFMDNCDLGHKNNDGNTALDILLSKTDNRISRSKDAIPILKTLLNHYQNNLENRTNSLFSSMLNNQLNHNISYKIPFLKTPFLLFAENVNLELLSYLGYDYSSIEEYKKSKREFFYHSFYEPNSTKERIFKFFIKGHELEKKKYSQIQKPIKFDLNIDKFLDHILEKNTSYYIKDNYSFDVNLELWEDMTLLLKLLIEHNIINPTPYIDKISERVVNYINDGIENHYSYLRSEESLTEDEKNSNKEDFLNKIPNLLIFLIQHQRLEEISNLNELVLNHDYNNDSIKVGLRYTILNNNINKKEDKSYPKKLKI